VAEGVLLLVLLQFHELDTRGVTGHMARLVCLALLVDLDLLFKLASVELEGLIAELATDVILVLHSSYHVLEVLLVLVTVLLHYLDVDPHSRVRLFYRIFLMVVFQQSMSILRSLKVKLQGQLLMHVNGNGPVQVFNISLRRNQEGFVNTLFEGKLELKDILLLLLLLIDFLNLRLLEKVFSERCSHVNLS
jgi:hypothetical protein